MHKNEEVRNCLLVLMEECSEVQKICSKIMRFGFDSYHPSDPEKKTNTVKLAEEYGDLVGTMDKLCDQLLRIEIPSEFWNMVSEFANKKPAKIDKYFKISQEI